MSSPAVFPALAIIAGIAAGISVPSASGWAVMLLPILLVSCAAAWRLRFASSVAGLALLGFACAGVLLGSTELRAARHAPLREFFDEASATHLNGLPPFTVEGVLRQDAFPTEYGAVVTLDVERVRTDCGWLLASGGLRVSIVGELSRGRLDEWRAGRRVRSPVLLRLPTSFRDPGVADETFAMTRRRIALAGSVKSGALVEVVRRAHPLAEWAAAARAYTRRAISQAIADRPVAAAIVAAILVGDRGGLDADVERRLQEAGTYHVIAISGGNVAILAGLAMALLRLARVPARAGSLVLATVICLYGYVAGGGASVARATISAAAYFVATAADLRSPALNVLASVALAAVIYDPLAVFDPGLLLSYGATVALLAAAERVLRRMRRNLFTTVAAVLVGTLAAELTLLPIVASVFHRVTVAGLVLNFFAIPLMTVAQIAGLAVLLLHPVSLLAARVAGEVAGAAAGALVQSTFLLDAAPWLTWRVPTPPPILIAAYYAGGLLALLAGKRTRVRLASAIASGCCALLIAFPALTGDLIERRSPPHGHLRVTFLDVGQGDSILVQFPGGASMLVDAAGLTASSFDLGDRVITPALLALGVRRLAYLAVTHGDPDHVEGAPSVARDFGPRELWQGVPVPPHQTLRKLEAMVARAGGAARFVRTDDRLRVGPVELRVLSPPEPDWERQRVRNDDSIVLELRYGDVAIVLPGDIGASIEGSLALRLSDAPIRILKAAHHGSATSSGDVWLTAARAAAVVFSCGRDNRYGHPAPVVLERVQAHGAAIFRTDDDGAITVTTDGKTATVTTFTGRSFVITGNHEGSTQGAIHKGHQGHKGRDTKEDQ